MPINMPGYRHLNIAQEGLSSVADSAIQFIERSRKEAQDAAFYKQMDEQLKDPVPPANIQMPSQPGVQNGRIPSQLNPIQNVPQPVPINPSPNLLQQRASMMQMANVDPMQAMDRIDAMNQPQYMNAPYGATVLQHTQANPSLSVAYENKRNPSTTGMKSVWRKGPNDEYSIVWTTTPQEGDIPTPMTGQYTGLQDGATDQKYGATHTLGTENPLTGKKDVKTVGHDASVGGGTSLSKDEITNVADGIINHLLPPNLKGYYRNAAPIAAQVAKRGFNLQAADTEWNGVQKHMASINSTTQVRFRQAVGTIKNTLPVIEKAYADLEQTQLPTGFQAWNKAAIWAAMKVPGPTGEKARSLVQLLSDFIPELGQAYMGGNTPTDKSLELAGNNLQADWNPGQFKTALANVKKVIGVREYAVSFTGPNGVPLDSPYMEGVTQGTGVIPVTPNADQGGQQGGQSKGQTFNVGGKTYNIPADQVEEFKKDMGIK